jgi:hypothetical protein
VTAVADAVVVRELFGHDDAKFTVMLPATMPLHTVDGNSDVQRGYACEAVISVIRIRARIVNGIKPSYIHAPDAQGVGDVDAFLQ